MPNMPIKPKLEKGAKYKEQPDFNQEAEDFSSRIPEPRLRAQVKADLLWLAGKLIFLTNVEKKKQASSLSVKSKEQKVESEQLRNVKYLLNLLVEPAYAKADAGSKKADIVRTRTKIGLMKWGEGGLGADSLEIQQDLKKMIDNISRNIGIESVNKVGDSIKIESNELVFKRSDEINGKPDSLPDLIKVKLGAGDDGNNIEGEFADGKKIAVKSEKGLSKEEIESNNKAAFLFFKTLEKKIGDVRNLLKEKESEIKKEEQIREESVEKGKVNSLLKELELENVDYKKYSLKEIDAANKILEKQFEDIKSIGGEASSRTGSGVLEDYRKARKEILERQAV